MVSIHIMASCNTLHSAQIFEETLNYFLNVIGFLFKSSKLQFLPILAAFQNSEPFLVALFCAAEKPKPIKDYVEDLVKEIKAPHQIGILHQGTVHKVKIKTFVCYAPATGFLLSALIGHNGFQGCKWCVAPTISVQIRVTYPSKNTCAGQMWSSGPLCRPLDKKKITP